MINKKRIITVIVFLIIAIVPVFLQYKIIKGFDQYPPRAEMYFENYSLYEKLQEEEAYLREKYIVSFVFEESAEYMEHKIKLIYKDENYIKFYPYDIEGENLNDRDQALISKGFSEKYLNGLNSVGQNIDISGKTYKISGIYTTSALENMSKSDSHAVYISSKPKESKESSYKILFSPKNKTPGIFFKEELKEYVFANIEYSDYGTYINDCTDYMTVVSQFYRGMFFVAAFLLFIFISLMLIGKLKHYGVELRFRLKTQYVNEIFLENVNNILIELIKLIIVLFLWIFLLRWIVSFQFEIPGRFLPVEDIFDFNFYGELYFSSKQHFSSELYDNLYKVALRLSRACFISYVIFAVAAFAAALNLKRSYKVIDEEGIKW